MRTLIYCSWECKMVQPLCKTAVQFFQELNRVTLYDPAILLLGMYPKEMKTYIYTCRGMLISLFIITKRWKQRKRPSDTCNNMNGSRRVLLNVRSNKLYEFVYMKYPEQTQERQKIDKCLVRDRGCGGIREMTAEAQDFF